ncbi:hypothetical protein [Streptomyces sp. NPDC020965]|uniref:hypothetical protein n=1 Tax=Streptomyces sp. NPDC020965 TaxID=3365105 RepID=UPI0037A96D56
MRIGHGAKTRGTVTAVLVAAALSLTLTACGDGGGGDGDKKNADTASTSTGSPEQPAQPKDGESTPASGEPLATIEGSNGFQITISGATRDSGGFLTVSGVLKNTTGKRLLPPIQWNGQETQVKRTGPSLGGMTLVDKAGKKRYYVLRDTDGFPLTTTGLSAFDSGESVDFFAQFPAPPEGTSSVELQIPLMPTTAIEIS